MAIKGMADITNKLKKIIRTRIKVIAIKITIPIAAIIVILAAFDWQNNKETTKVLQANMYANALKDGETDLAQLVEIKGDESSGYHLEFVSDIDERLEKVIKANKETYKVLGVTIEKDGVATLKKFLRAQMATEFPHLGARMSGESNGGATGSINGGPDLSNTTYYPRDVQNGWCQWYAMGRVREVYGIDIPSGSYLQMGSLPSKYGGHCFQEDFCKAYSEYFELSEEPAPGAIYCGRAKDHVGFIRAVDLDAGTITIEDGNSLPWGNGTFINWTSEYGIINRQGGSAGLAIHTETIDYFKQYWNPIYCVPTEKAKALMKDANITEKPATKTNVNSLEGVLFIGDSITEGLEHYKSITDAGVQFRGVNSARPSHWLNDESVKGKPTFSSLPNNSDSISAICLMLGANGIDNPTNQADTMKQLIEKIHDKYPDKTIYVQQILPVRGYESEVETYNSKLKEICSSYGYTVCINSTTNVELSPSDGIHPTAEGSKTLAENTRQQIIMGAQTGGTVVSDPNAFQGSIRIRRVTPDKAIGEYKSLEELTKEIDDNEDIKKDINTGEGLGKKEDIPESVKKVIIGNTVPEDKKEVLNDLSYLTIPYVDFKGAVKQGHLLVNKNIADEVLYLFQDLYNIKYPIEKMEIIDAYKNEEGANKSSEYKAIDDNNTYSFYYLSENSHSTGNTIAINPKINPKVENGNPGHKNAIKYANREQSKMDKWRQEEKDACIEKDSEAYKIFAKYGFVWAGENGENPNYMDFEKAVTSSSDKTQIPVNTRIYDLSYVPEEVFDKYINDKNPRALRVFTLDKDKKLTIASWSVDKGVVTYSKGQTINYKSALSKYTMPVEYLLAMLQYTEDSKFTEGVADLAIDSEYIIAVEDKVNTIRTTTITSTDTMNVSNATGQGTLDSSSSNSSVEITERASQKIEVTYVDCWFVKYSRDFSFNVQTTIPNNAGGEVSFDGEQGDKIGDFEITAYCACAQCCGTSTGITASGAKVQAGLTIAVDPSVIPLGSYVSFNDHIYHAEDTGGAIKGNIIDLYMDSHQEALNWGRRTLPVYWAKDVSGESTKNTTPTNKNLINIVAKVMADVNETQTKEVSVSTSEIQGPVKPDANGEQSYHRTLRTTTTVIIDSISIEYNTGNDHIYGNAQKFIDLYNREEFSKMRQNVYAPWLADALLDNEKTAPLSEVTEYLFSRATHKNYKTNTLKFENYKPGEFKQYSSASGLGTFKEYLHSWEGHTGISADGTKYIVGDDGAGHPTVGYGIDIYNSGFLDRFKAAGYDVSIGAEIDVDFVDALEDEEIKNALAAVESTCAGINLTQYQKYALVSRIYNCGVAGALTVPRSGKTFVEAYNAYWDQSKDDEYGVPANEGMYNHRLYTTFMNEPTTSAGMFLQGLQNRRKSEWILFKTGYYDRIGKSCSSSAGGDFLEVARSVWAKVCEQQPIYSMAFGKTVPPGDPIGYMDCSHYVSWVLYEYGYTEFEGAQQNTYTLVGTNWNAKYGWEEIAIGNGDVSSQLEPGDILVRNGGGGGHTCIVADTSGGKIMAYDCGSGTNQLSSNTWAGRWSEVKGSDSPVDSTYFATGNYGAGKIIRVKAP